MTTALPSLGIAAEYYPFVERRARAHTRHIQYAHNLTYIRSWNTLCSLVSFRMCGDRPHFRTISSLGLSGRTMPNTRVCTRIRQVALKILPAWPAIDWTRRGMEYISISGFLPLSPAGTQLHFLSLFFFVFSVLPTDLSALHRTQKVSQLSAHISLRKKAHDVSGEGGNYFRGLLGSRALVEGGLEWLT